MRYASEHKDETKARVLREAESEIRAKGPAGVGVAGIMARAGLTHGGFYAHFTSKDDLIAQAVDAMRESALRRFERRTADAEGPHAVLRAYVDFYLSPGHRDAREQGCALAALSGDMPRIDGAARTGFSAAIEGLSGRLEQALAAIGEGDPAASSRALLAQMVGAVMLARAVENPVMSDAMLADARAAIVARFGLETAA